jgi:N-methylhydantoinase A/oxoprolinase/acetone carboxylase beta subunit
MIENGTGAASEALVGKKTNRTTTAPKVAVQQKMLSPPTPNYKLSIEVGRTFTNLVLLNTVNGALYFGKTLTTYPNLIDGILNGAQFLLELYKVSFAHVRTMIHGTTLATNPMQTNEEVPASEINVFIPPMVEQYFVELEQRLEQIDFKGVIQIINSSGHVIALDEARKMPIQFDASGIAGGVMLGAFISRKSKIPQLWTLDMGGTAVKVAVIRNGQPEMTNGLVSEIKIVDIIKLDIGGHSTVQAAAETPNSWILEPTHTVTPACFGHGGGMPTITDADLVLGFLNENYFLGGSIILHKDLAIKVLHEKIAKPLGISVENAASMIQQMVHEKMVNSAQSHLLERGFDPRTLPMMAYGSAGTLHAFQVARLLGVRQLIFPVGAGIAAALGFLVSPERLKSEKGRFIGNNIPNLPLKQISHRTKHPLYALKGHRLVYLGGKYVECPVYDRYALRVGDKLPSPVVIEEVESTIVIGANATVHLDRFENIIVNLHY